MYIYDAENFLNNGQCQNVTAGQNTGFFVCRSLVLFGVRVLKSLYYYFSKNLAVLHFKISASHAQICLHRIIKF